MGLGLQGLGSIIFKEWRVTWTFSYTSEIIIDDWIK
jgi:hypothetical protein